MDSICEVLGLSGVNASDTVTQMILLTTEGPVEDFTYLKSAYAIERISGEASDDNPLGGNVNHTFQEKHHVSWDFLDWNKKVIVPALCAFGLFGNALNLAILGKRIKEGLYFTILTRFFPVHNYL